MRLATWDTECRRSLVFPNANGDVGICGLWTKTEDIAERRVFADGACAERVAVAGPVRTPLGVGWMLRGLWLQPTIRHLIVTGQDLSNTGTAVVNLWRDGPTEDGRIPGLGWTLQPPIDIESVNELRRDVTVWDWRGIDNAEVCRRLADLDRRPPQRPLREFPPLEITEREQLPSRGTLYPIYVETVGEGWLHVLNAIMTCGETKGTRKGDRLKEILNTAVVIEPRYLDHDPIEAPFFDFSADAFESYWSDFMARQKPSGQDYSYGERMQNWSAVPAHIPTRLLVKELLGRGRDALLRRSRNGGDPAYRTGRLARSVDQLAQVRERLRRAPDTKRGTIVFLGPTDMEDLDDAPCLSMATFNRWDGRLFGTFVIRSNDMYGAWPFNALSLRRLQTEMADELGVPAGATTIVSHSAHIYERHWEQAYVKVDEWLTSNQIMKWYRELGWSGPTGGLRPDPAGSFEFVDTPEGVRIRLMTRDADRLLREVSGSNPRPLLRGLLYRMPWIEPSHAEYLGEQVEALLRSRADGREFHQG